MSKKTFGLWKNDFHCCAAVSRRWSPNQGTQLRNEYIISVGMTASYPYPPSPPHSAPLAPQCILPRINLKQQLPQDIRRHDLLRHAHETRVPSIRPDDKRITIDARWTMHEVHVEW